jgi:hypothetical protein
MGSQSAGHLLIVALVIAGNVGYFLLRRRGHVTGNRLRAVEQEGRP